MRKKFKIMYPNDYYTEEEKRGKQYKSKGKDMIVMNQDGVFFMFNGERYYPSLCPLHDVLPKYDVIWKGDE